MASHDHIPVLLEEAVSFLAPKPGDDFIDATLGRAGHAGRILELCAPNGRLLGIDADQLALDSARVSLRAFAGRVALIHTYFDHIGEAAHENGFDQVDGILFDLGVSSPQLEDPSRGFSFSHDGPLDMRLGPGDITAADILATSSQAELSRIFREYGEERYANRVARRVVIQRERESIATTRQLAELVVRAIPGARTSIHPATRVFQALRIAVNHELDRLQSALEQSVGLLQRGGRLVVISFHSLEDRIVKRFFRAEARGCVCPPGDPCVCGRLPRLRILTPKPISPSEQETKLNPRSRSAKLRAAEAI